MMKMVSSRFWANDYIQYFICLLYHNLVLHFVFLSHTVVMYLFVLHVHYYCIIPNNIDFSQPARDKYNELYGSDRLGPSG